VARGWESKSIEAQQADAGEQVKEPRVKLTAKEATVVREREGLSLARKRVLQQIEASSNPRHRQLLEDALADLDRKLKQLEK
jgi:DNA-directed RNA polymerase sigma subunit (sigma70/sigma32)